MNAGDRDSKYILAIDIGTTNIKCIIYDDLCQIVGKSFNTITIINPKKYWYEICPESLWSTFIECIKNAIDDAKLKASDISTIGISTQRATFVTWDSQTGETFHNFITWNDRRAQPLCDHMNKMFQIRCLKGLSKLLSVFAYRYSVISKLNFTTGMTLTRFLWVLENFPIIRKKEVEGRAKFGTIDTYLVWRLTGGAVHATDPSNACVSGFFDIFTMKWSDFVIDLFNIPASMLPIVNDTNANYGTTIPELFGSSIPINAVVGDQQAAMFGDCCFNKGDIKCTMGTGTFLDINCGTSLATVPDGMYPIIGWKLKNSKAFYLIEGSSYDTGATILWAQKIGLFDDPKFTEEMAKACPDSGDVYFVPSFNGLQAPFNDNQSTAAFIGLNSNTTKEHLVRAILESLAFRVKQIYEILDRNYVLNNFRINGGISSNNFVVQLISDLTGKQMIRSDHKEISCLGTAYLAGLSSDVWSDLKQIEKLNKIDKVFNPKDSWNQYRKIFFNWERAVQRCLNWENNQ